MNNKECIILSRVSTESQDYSPQKADLIKYAKSFGYTKFHYISTKESGFKAIDGKEGFKEVTDYISFHPDCKAVFVTEISRLARRQSIIQSIKDWFINNKIQLYVKDIAFQLFKGEGENLIKDNSADIVFAVFSSIAESEMEAKKQRFSRARRNLQAKGLSHTGKVLFGYAKELDDISRKKKLVIVPELQKQIVDIMTTYVNGIEGRSIGIRDLTLYAIEKGYHNYLHSKRNVNKLLKEEAYTGEKITHNRYKNTAYWVYGQKDKEKYIYTQNTIRYPILIDKSLFEQVQTKLKNNNTNVDRERQHISILSRLIKCDCCGGYLSGTYRKRGGYAAYTYRCTRRNTIHNCENANKCYSMQILDAVMWDFIKAFGQEMLHAMRQNNPKINIKVVEKEISNLEEHKCELQERRVVAGNIYRRNRKRKNALEEYNDEMSSIDNEERILQKRIKEKERLIQQIKNTEKWNYEIKQVCKLYEEDKLQIRNIIKQFVKEITIVFSDIKYTILNIKSLQYHEIDDNNNFANGGLVEYYAFIDKRNNHGVRYAFIMATSKVYFEYDKFVLSTKKFTLDEISNMFKDDYWLRDVLLSMGEEIPFRMIIQTDKLEKLDVYQND